MYMYTYSPESDVTLNLSCCYCVFSFSPLYPVTVLIVVQGFMQDKIIASHTCFGGHMDINC